MPRWPARACSSCTSARDRTASIAEPVGHAHAQPRHWCADNRSVRLVPTLLALAGTAMLPACAPSPPSSDGCKAALAPGDLVITEVFADYKAATGGSDTGKEWFE